MSTTRDRGMVVFECDSCGDTLETDAKDFDDAKSIMEEEGWVASNTDGTWKHECKDCANDFVIT